MNEKVSVIIPTYLTNAEKQSYFREALQSVLHQTYHDRELIIVNDNPDEEASQRVVDVVFENPDERIKIIRNLSNLGIAGARNVGTGQAKHDLLAFLDHDDRWLPEKLSSQVDFVNKKKLGWCG